MLRRQVKLLEVVEGIFTEENHRTKVQRYGINPKAIYYILINDDYAVMIVRCD